MVLALFQLKSPSNRSCAAFILSWWHPASDCSLTSAQWSDGSDRDTGTIGFGQGRSRDGVETNTDHTFVLNCYILCSQLPLTKNLYIHSYNLDFIRHVYLEPWADRLFCRVLLLTWHRRAFGWVEALNIGGLVEVEPQGNRPAVWGLQLLLESGTVMCHLLLIIWCLGTASSCCLLGRILGSSLLLAHLVRQAWLCWRAPGGCHSARVGTAGPACVTHRPQCDPHCTCKHFLLGAPNKHSQSV